MDGEVLYEAEGTPQRAVNEATAFLMSAMLSDVLTSGTAAGARRYFTLPAAGKTGTTNDFRDAWFVGYTPTLATGVWVGYDMPRTIARDGYAAQLAVPIWARFMRVATRGQKADWLKPPPTVTSAGICRISGKLATSSCREVPTYDRDGFLTIQSAAYTEYFVRGTEPTTYCDRHGYQFDTWRTVGTRGVLPEPSHSRDIPATPENAVSNSPERPVSTPSERPVSTPEPRAAVNEPASAPLPPESQVAAPAAPSRSGTKRPGFWGRIFGRR
jgi:penicillin-binding protein 1A